jgi:hypothetical protein
MSAVVVSASMLALAVSASRERAWRRERRALLRSLALATPPPPRRRRTPTLWLSSDVADAMDGASGLVQDLVTGILLGILAVVALCSACGLDATSTLRGRNEL